MLTKYHPKKKKIKKNAKNHEALLIFQSNRALMLFAIDTIEYLCAQFFLKFKLFIYKKSGGNLPTKSLTQIEKILDGSKTEIVI